MKKTESNLSLLTALFCTFLVLANILASKIVQIGFITIPAAVVAYPWTFLMTDIIGELWGKKQANRAVIIGLICQISTLILIFLAIKLPIADFANNQEQFQQILGSGIRITIASLIAYLCSQSWDVWIFHKIRNYYIKKHGTIKGGKWLWNNGSTMTSQIIDTVIFIGIGFYGTVPNLIAMMASQYIIKFIFAALDTLPFYILTRNSKTVQDS